MSALRELILLRIRSFMREPEALFWTFGFPILLAIGLGLAFREEVEAPPVPIGIVVGSAGQRYTAALHEAREVEPILMGSAAADLALRRGEVPLVLSGATGLVFRYDPARSESLEARLLADAVVQASAGGVRPVRIENDPERLPGSRYIDWLIPGLIGLNLMSTGMWGIGFGIVHMRQKKQLKRLIATPMKRSDFLLAQILARMAFLGLEVPPIIVFAWLAFDVEVAGSLVALLLVVLLGALAFSGLGLLAASRAKTVEGVSGINNLMMLPMFVLSGVFFPSSRFPDAMQPIIRALPLTALNDAVRGIYNEGISILALPGELAILVGWTVASFAIALKLFRWQ